MSDKAQVSNKFKDFKANLTTRPWIVWGMGIRGFEKLFNWNNKIILSLIGIIYLWTFVFYVVIGSESEYPCEFIGEQDSKDFYMCKPIAYYADLQYGGIRIFLVSLAAIASSGLIANDMANKSINLYLSRPISRLDYLIARFIPIFMLLILVTVIPNIIVYVTRWSDAGLEFDWIKENNWLLINIITQGIVYSAAYSTIGLTFSTIINREYRAAGAFFLFVYGTNIIVETFFAIIKDDRLVLLSISHLLDIVSFYIFDKEYYFTAFGDLRPLMDIEEVYAILALVLLITGCGLLINWMITNMEASE